MTGKVIAFVMGMVAMSCCLPGIAATNVGPYHLASPQTVQIENDGKKLTFLTFMDVPLRFRDWPEFAARRNLEYSTSTERESNLSGIGCGHSPLCVVVLPIAVAGYLLSPELTQVQTTNAEEKLALYYLQKGDLLTGGKFDDGHISLVYFDALERGYVYHENQRAQVRPELLRSVTDFLSKLNAKEQHHLIDQLAVFEPDTETLFQHYVEPNAFRGPARARLLENSCYLIRSPERDQTLQKIIATPDDDAMAELMECFDNQELDAALLPAVKPVLQYQWEHIKRQTSSQDFVDLKAFTRITRIAIQIDATLAFLDKSGIHPDLASFLTVSTGKALPMEEYLRIARKRWDYARYLSEVETLTIIQDSRTLQARIKLMPERQRYHSAIIQDAFAAIDKPLLDSLTALYLDSYYEPERDLLFYTTDLDISRQADMLPHFPNLPKSLQQNVRDTLASQPRAQWKLEHLALHYSLGGAPDPALDAPILSPITEDTSLPTTAADVSTTCDKSGRPAPDLAWFGIHLTGMEEAKIQQLQKAFRPAPDTHSGDKALEQATEWGRKLFSR